MVDARSGTSLQPIPFRADPAGESTGDSPGRVALDGGGTEGSVIRLSRASFIVIDGFVVTGAGGGDFAGIEVRTQSNNITVRHCEVLNNRTGGPDGIAVRDSEDILLFNNLVFNNGRRGIV